MMETSKAPQRKRIFFKTGSIFLKVVDWLEDTLYYLIAIILAIAAVVLLYTTLRLFVFTAPVHIHEGVLSLLNSMLLVMMLVEIFHTIRVSLRQHTLSPDPFLIIGIIAAIRRMLVITAEQADLQDPTMFHLVLEELLLLGVTIILLAISTYILHRSECG